jgi:hypothetical protein
MLRLLERWNNWPKTFNTSQGTYSLVSATVKGERIVRVTLKFLEGDSYISGSVGEIGQIIGPEWVTSLI